LNVNGADGHAAPTPDIQDASPASGIVAEDGFIPRCPHCDYILIGLTVERCPECGRRFSLAQLRAMHLRRKPTPWEDPERHRGIVRRYLATSRAILRPPFFLFLARPRRSGPAIRFAAATLLLVSVFWVAVACAEIAYGQSAGSRWRYSLVLFDFFGITSRISRGLGRGFGLSASGLGVDEIVGLAVSGVLFVLVAYLFFVLLLRAGFALLSTASLASRNKAVVRQIVAYLSCWFLAGLAVFVAGVAGRIPVDAIFGSLFVPPEFMFFVIALAEVVLMTVWCCHADAAVRDGLENTSRSFGPILVLTAAPVALVLGGLLAYGLMLAAVGLL
jgi:hypothetical protein